ncbi:hypothetical protein [Phaeobacter inhibens]|uniref:hypothetical protein n=1 Tax=Phaeobacter inhibens TaxID=221822 RepID=UPI00295ED309|nr:hypothetical protein [Phaeobacter inhibens]
MPDDIEAVIFELAKEASAADPDSWADLDFSDEAIEQDAQATLQQELEDAESILAMMPGGAGTASLLGGMTGVTLDVKNAPFLLMGGGGGSIMRIMGREAMLNMGAEAAFLPSQFEMARFLDRPDPKVIEQLGMAAAAGGLLGGAVEALSRGISYFQMRNRVPEIPGYDEFTARAMVDQVEDILTSDTPRPFEQIERLWLEMPSPEQPPKFTQTGDVVAGRTASATFPEINTTTPVDVQGALQSNALYQAARGQNPRVFEQMEGLKEKQRRLRGWLDDLRTGKNTQKDATVALIDQRIAALKEEHRITQGKSNKKRIREAIREAKADRESVLSTDIGTDTQDERLVRRQLRDIDETLRDLAPDIGAAYRTAGPVDLAPLIDATDEASVDFAQFVADMDVPVPALPSVRAASATRLNESILVPEPPRQTAPASVEAAGGEGSRAPMALFDDPASSDARNIQQNVASSFRDEIEANGPTVVDMVTEDGRVLRTDQDVLDYLDEGDQFAARIKLCGMAPGGEA